MEGKIFKDSSNIYNDQARVIYDYYKEAALRIVSEEKDLEAKIKDAEHTIRKLEDDIKKAGTMLTAGVAVSGVALLLAIVFMIVKIDQSSLIVIVGLILLVLGIVLALPNFNNKKKFEQALETTRRDLAGFRKAHKEIFRDYAVTKLGVAYVPVAKRVAYNDKSFIVDQTGVTSKEHFVLQVIKQSDIIDGALQDLRNLTKEAPIVESSKEPESVNTSELSRSIQKVNFNDYFGKMDRTLRTISYGLGNVEEYNVDLPVVFPDTEYARFLEEHTASKPSGSPVFRVFDTSRFDGDIKKFNELNETRKALSNESEQVDKVLKELMVDMADAVQATAARKVASAGSLVDYSNRILYNILKAPYNFYSPSLEADEIERMKQEKFDYESVDYSYKPFNLRESSRVRLDLRSMSWVAEDGSRTTVPFGVNQIQYEIIAPIVTNLMKDTRKDRLEIYNHIKDQKLSYLNKWHQDTEDFYGRNRAEAADIINLMRSTLADYSAAYNTLAAYKKTEESMTVNQSLESAKTETTDNSADVLAGYQAQSQQVMAVQKEFSNYMDSLHSDIDRRAEQFGYIEYYDASLRDKKSRDMAVASEGVNNLDDRRKPLAQVSPLLARESELPPTPSIDSEAYEFAGMNLNALAKEALDELRETEQAKIDRSEKPAAVLVADADAYDADADADAYDADADADAYDADADADAYDADADADAYDADADANEAEEQEYEVVAEEYEVTQEEEVEEEEDELTVEDIQELLDVLNEMELPQEYRVAEMTEDFGQIVEALDATEDEEELESLYARLYDIYEAAYQVYEQFSDDEE